MHGGGRNRDRAWSRHYGERCAQVTSVAVPQLVRTAPAPGFTARTGRRGLGTVLGVGGGVGIVRVAVVVAAPVVGCWFVLVGRGSEDVDDRLRNRLPGRLV